MENHEIEPLKDRAENEMSFQEAVMEINSLGYFYDHGDEKFTVWDQLYICRQLNTSSVSKTPYKGKTDQEGEGAESVSVSENGSDACKRSVNFELNQNKTTAKTWITQQMNDVVLQLSRCTYKTPPNDIAPLLEALFAEWPSIDGHWLYICQKWPPRQINRTITQLIKQADNGEVTVKNPSAYFTMLIKYRKCRKSHRSNVDKVSQSTI